MMSAELLDFLPRRIFDAHVHVFDVPPETLAERDYRRKFNGRFTAADYRAMAARELPGKEISLNIFGMPERTADCPAADDFCGREVDRDGVFALALTRPDEPAAALEARMRRDGLSGLKPYPDLVPGKPLAEVELFDMLSPGQLELADRHHWVVTIHLPRRGRLLDPLNQQQLEVWFRRYPNARFVVAHLGRSYFFKGIDGQLDRFRPYENAYFDTAMINHDRVLEYAFRRYPRERLLFGTDAPISLLLGKALEINDQYLYLMGEDYAIGTSLDGRGAPVKFRTFFAEQLDACRTAVLAAGLSAAEKEQFFYENGRNLLREASQWLA